MPTSVELAKELRAGGHDGALARLYAPDGGETGLSRARDRAAHAAEGFVSVYGERDNAALFSGPGRTEIGGNHTDHQHGHVLCASVDMDILACAAPNGERVIRVTSEGYPALEISLDDLDPKEDEKNTSAALVRGVAARLTETGRALSGFDAYAVSAVPAGSGLSSSAAYEVLIGTILNFYCCGMTLSPVDVARVGQYAENVYFGKPSGLMDQMGSALGGAVAIDFGDPDDPRPQRVEYDFSRSGHALCIVDTGSSHGDLTDDYADITREMGAVAGCFGCQFLRDVPEADFRANLPALREQCGDRAVLRAMHYYADDRRAAEEAEALAAGAFDRFLALVNASGLSSETLLQNVWSPADPSHQAVAVALAVGRELLGGRGAIRVHGGGFAGTIQAFVPDDLLDAFKAGMEELLGIDCCHVLHIRPYGGTVVAGGPSLNTLRGGPGPQMR